jgi:hypothetical protein
MITITVIKSPKVECKNCHEAHAVVEEVVKNFPGEVKLEVLFSNTPEAQAYGIITTPVIAIDKKICSMGKPVIKDQVENWIKKVLGK